MGQPVETVLVDARPATAGSTPAEEPPLGVELILTAGDSLFVEEPQDEMRNAGEDEVVLFIAALNPLGQDIGTLLDERDPGTPTP